MPSIFDQTVDRRGSGSVKWDCEEARGTIPMWVADMDFRAATPIIEALSRRVSHGVFGYTQVPDAYYEAIIHWFARRHSWHIDREWIIYTSGVVPALSAVVKALAQPGDKVIIQTPVYNCFFSSIRNNGCIIEENPLVYDGHTYHIDFHDLERKAADPSARLLVVCNPHNPAGRVWTPDELERMNDICLRHGVRVVSDEIHCELVMPGHRFTPFASISPACQDNCITLNSPSKSWNIAGLQIANIICNNPDIRQRIDRAININEVCDVNPFGGLTNCANTSMTTMSFSANIWAGTCPKWASPPSKAPTWCGWTSALWASAATKLPKNCCTRGKCSSTMVPCTVKQRERASSASTSPALVRNSKRR